MDALFDAARDGDVAKVARAPPFRLSMQTSNRSPVRWHALMPAGSYRLAESTALSAQHSRQVAQLIAGGADANVANEV